MKIRLPVVLLAVGLAFTGCFVLPVASYMTGKRVIGPYEGKLGLSDYLGSIYAAAGRGEPLAWWLLLSPVLVAGTWYLLGRVGRRLTGGGERPDAG